MCWGIGTLGDLLRGGCSAAGPCQLPGRRSTCTVFQGLSGGGVPHPSSQRAAGAWPLLFPGTWTAAVGGGFGTYSLVGTGVSPARCSGGISVLCLSQAESFWFSCFMCHVCRITEDWRERWSMSWRLKSLNCLGSWVQPRVTSAHSPRPSRSCWDTQTPGHSL